MHAGEYAPRQNEIDPIFDEFGFEYATAGGYRQTRDLWIR